MIINNAIMNGHGVIINVSLINTDKHCDTNVNDNCLGPPMELITITSNDIRKISSNLRSVEVIHSLQGLYISGFDTNAIDDNVYWSNG